MTFSFVFTRNHENRYLLCHTDCKLEMSVQWFLLTLDHTTDNTVSTEITPQGNKEAFLEQTVKTTIEV